MQMQLDRIVEMDFRLMNEYQFYKMSSCWRKSNDDMSKNILILQPRGNGILLVHGFSQLDKL